MRMTAVALALILVSVAGCGRGPYQASTYKDGTTSLEHSEKLILADNIAGKVRLVDSRSIVLEDGRLEAYAEIENKTSKNLVVQIQTQFKDAMGTLTEDESNWQTIVMPPHSSTGYRQTSFNDKAKDYIIRVKLEKEH